MVYEVTEGAFDYNGILLPLHKDTAHYAAGEPHPVIGWHLVPAIKHCRYGKYFINHTYSVRISNTAKILPNHC